MNSDCLSIFVVSSHADVSEWRSLLNEDSLVFALTEEGIDALREARISYFTLDDLLEEKYNPDIIFEKIRSLYALCSQLDCLLQEFSTNEPVKAFTHKLHALRIPFFLYAYYIDHLHFLLIKYKPRNIYISYTLGSVSLSSFAEQIIQDLALDTQVATGINPTVTGISAPDWYLKSSLFKVVAKKALGRTPYKKWRSLFSAFFGYNFFFNKKNTALVHSVDWEHEILLGRLEKNFNFIFCEDLACKPNRGAPKWAPKALSLILTNSELQEIKYKGIPVLLFFQNEIEIVLNHDWNFLYKTQNVVSKLFVKFDFKFFFSSYYLTQTEAINSLFNKMNRHTYLMLHGGTAGIVKGVPYTPMSTHGEPNDLTNLLVYSESIAKDCAYVKSELPSFTPKVVAVGDLYFKKFLRPRPPPLDAGRGLKICYVFSGTGIFNAMGKWGGCSDASLYDLRLKVLDLVEKRSAPDIEFVFKSGYNFENKNLELISRINSSNQCDLIGSSSRLTEFAEDFDWFLIELPSTSLLELMSMNKNLIVLFDEKSMEICEDVKEDLLQSVNGTFNIKDFLSEIEKILSVEATSMSTSDRPSRFVTNFTGNISTEKHFELCEDLIQRS